MNDQPASLPAKLDVLVRRRNNAVVDQLAANFERVFATIADQVVERWGFRLGDKGTHSTRTIMVEELTTLLAMVPSKASRDRYAS